jgi:hypothetical protein
MVNFIETNIANTKYVIIKTLLVARYKTIVHCHLRNLRENLNVIVLAFPLKRSSRNYFFCKDV